MESSAHSGGHSGFFGEQAGAENACYLGAGGTV